MDLFTYDSDYKTDVVKSTTSALTNVCPIDVLDEADCIINRRKGFDI